MTKRDASRPGVLTLEIELAKPLSHHRGVVLELAWADMLNLPISSDKIDIDRVRLDVVHGPADDEILLDMPNSLQDFTWKCRYSNGEWMSADALGKVLRNDKRVLSVRALQ